MKILILNNNIKFETATDFTKAKEYFTSNFVKSIIPNGIDIEFFFKEINIPTSVKEYLSRQGFNSQTGKPTLVHYYGLEDSIRYNCLNLVKENEFDIVIFMWDMDILQSTLTGGDKVITSYTESKPLYPKTEFIQLAVSQYKKNLGDIYKAITHEILHAITFKANREGVVVLDEMDNTIVNGAIIPFFKNDFPFDQDGNYAHTLKNLKLYFNKDMLYKPKNFTLKELVPQSVIEKYGESSWQFLDERLLRNLQFFRDTFGGIIINTSTEQYRGFDPVGFRKHGYSQHNHGRAADCTFKNTTTEKVIEWLRNPENVKKLPEPNIWVELGVSHFHFDVRYSDKKGVYFFVP